jgi:peptidoglycan-associated lipoprotein
MYRRAKSAFNPCAVHLRPWLYVQVMRLSGKCKVGVLTLDIRGQACHCALMSNKIANVGFAVLAVAGVLASGCSKKTPMASNTPRTPVAGPSNAGSTESGRQQTASNDSGSSRTTVPSPSNGAISQADRDTLNQRLAKLEDVLFDYDKATIRPDATKALEGDVAVVRGILERYPTQKVKIEGHADERGSDEYNVALGDKRALAAQEFLTGMGIKATQLEIVSYGKQRPVCGEHTEDCWQKNRRAHLSASNQ